MKCKASIFEHNKGIFHLGQCPECYQSNVINEDETPSEPDSEAMDKEAEIVQSAMALARTGWQMACDELLSFCNDKKVSPEFMDQIFSMMDEKKKRQFSWEKLREEMQKMGLNPNESPQQSQPCPTTHPPQ